MDLHGDDLENEIARDNETHIEVKISIKDDFAGAYLGKKAHDEEHVKCEEATEVSVLGLDKLHLHLMALDNLNDGVTNESENEANDDEALKFNDDSMRGTNL
ncbi:hypothetical protein GOBAR_AA08644 [Gossypium barbadense]|uniref:Uncharacterized protein n=1 Tax=Gossypium barbadense TaxID=3634 RepID=A0A2P5Y8U4_GOSBA|nr:hypothetical protein GOBAR_AA08644 [Gossypium barbadense]